MPVSYLARFDTRWWKIVVKTGRLCDKALSTTILRHRAWDMNIIPEINLESMTTEPHR